MTSKNRWGMASVIACNGHWVLDLWIFQTVSISLHVSEIVKGHSSGYLFTLIFAFQSSPKCFFLVEHCAQLLLVTDNPCQFSLNNLRHFRQCFCRALSIHCPTDIVAVTSTITTLRRRSYPS